MKPDRHERLLHFADLDAARAWLTRQRVQCRELVEDIFRGGWRLAASPQDYRRSRTVCGERDFKVDQYGNLRIGNPLLCNPKGDPLAPLNALAELLA